VYLRAVKRPGISWLGEWLTHSHQGHNIRKLLCEQCHRLIETCCGNKQCQDREARRRFEGDIPLVLIRTYHTGRRHVPENRNLIIYCREPKSVSYRNKQVGYIYLCPLHEGVWGQQTYNSTCFKLWSVSRHGSLVLRENSSCYVQWAHGRLGRFGEDINSLPLSGFLSLLSNPTSSLVTILTEQSLLAQSFRYHTQSYYSKFRLLAWVWTRWQMLRATWNGGGMQNLSQPC
jgi:hypothetical protein